MENQSLPPPIESAAAESTPTPEKRRGASLLFLSVVVGAIAVPQFIFRKEQPAPVVVQPPPTAAEVQAAAPQPIPVQPSQDDLAKALNAAIAAAQTDWDLFVKIRSDQFMKQAKASDDAQQWLLKTCSKLISEYQQQTWKQGTYEGTAEDADKIRTMQGDSLACLVAIRRINAGEASTGRAVQPQPQLDKARIALGVLAAKLGANGNDYFAKQPQENPSGN